jgi:hypothetical protein
LSACTSLTYNLLKNEGLNRTKLFEILFLDNLTQCNRFGLLVGSNPRIHAVSTSMSVGSRSDNPYFNTDFDFF